MHTTKDETKAKGMKPSDYRWIERSAELDAVKRAEILARYP